MPSKADAADDDFDSGVTLRPSRRIPLKIIIGLLAVLLIAVTAVSATFVVFYVMRSDSSSDNNSNSNSNVCQTEACFDLSVQIKGAMDETADPCNDFYNFTCGNWAFFNHITPGIKLSKACGLIYSVRFHHPFIHLYLDPFFYTIPSIPI